MVSSRLKLNSRFVFGGDASIAGDVDVDASNDIEVVSDAGLASQEGIDHFAIDISQFAGEGHGAGGAQAVPGIVLGLVLA